MAANSPAFAILRTQKLKHLGSVRRSLKHSFREQETPNADLSRTQENSHFGANSTAEAMSALMARLPEKRRKDAVLAIEYLVTASPEAMRSKTRQGQDEYFADAIEWLKKRHGAENVVYAGIHRDETTPHLYAYVVPLDADTGNLNAKKWLGGAKALSHMQTDFAKNVGKQHGFDRGVENSKAKHQTIRQFYGNLSKSEHIYVDFDSKTLNPKVLSKTFFTKVVETPEMVAKRVSEEVRGKIRPITEIASMARQSLRRANEMQATAKKLSEINQALKVPFEGLTKDQMVNLLAQAQGFRIENQARARDLEKKRALERSRKPSRGKDFDISM